MSKALIVAMLLCWSLPSRAQDQMAAGNPSLNFSIADWVEGLNDVTDFRFLPDGRMVIIEKSGAVRIIHVDRNQYLAGTFTVETASEMGLLGVAVDPDFTTNGLLYFYYSVPDGFDGGSDQDRGHVTSVQLVGDTLNMSTERVLLRGIRSSLHTAGGNHNGGELEIGPDGRIYVGVGDTGFNSNESPIPNPYPPTNYWGTCLTVPNGKVLRIERDGGIPADNPLATGLVYPCDPDAGGEPTPVNTATANAVPRRDIYAWGFRNPFRFSFDTASGNLWLGDVGEVSFEEVNVVNAGEHHGWPWREGAFGYDAGICDQITPGSGQCVDPVYFCRHDDIDAGGVDGNCVAITGGVFVDSCTWPPAFQHLYYFGDNSNGGSIWSLLPNALRNGTQLYSDGGSPRQDFAVVDTNGGAPVAFHVGPDGNLYIAAYATDALAGRIVRIAPFSPLQCDLDAGYFPFDGGAGVIDAGSDGGGTGGGVTNGPQGPSGNTVAHGCTCGTAAGVPALLMLLAVAMFARSRRRA